MSARLAVLTLSAALTLTLPLAAQSFNINFTGSSLAVADSFGGAASQTGRWDKVDLETSTAKKIRLLNGSYGCPKIKPSVPIPTFRWPDPRVCGTIEPLLNSFAQVSPGGANIDITGMKPGNYRVWVYGRHPISCWYGCTTARTTKISVNGSAVQDCGGGGGYSCTVTTPILGVNYRVFDATVTGSGLLRIRVEPHAISAFGAINGVQVKCLGSGAACFCVPSIAAGPAVHADAPSGVGVGRPIRLQQVHRDLAGAAQTILGQSFRRDAMARSNQTAGARAVELALWAGEGNLDRTGGSFASNYVGQRTAVVQRKRVNFPDWRRQPTQGPAPFDLQIQYDRPFRYSGRGDFVWELVVYAGPASTDTHPFDAQQAPSERRGSQGLLGTGCTALGQSAPMQANAVVTTYRAAAGASLTYEAHVQHSAPQASCAVLVGTQNPAFPMPLCRPDLRLYTDAAILIQGQANRNGTYRTAKIPVQWSGSLAGAPLFTQAVSVGAGGLTVSNGVFSPIPSLPQPGPYAWVRGNAPTSTTGALEHGRGLVTSILR